MGVLTAVQKRQGKGKPYERAEGLDLSEGSTVTLLEASVRELIREHPSEGLCYGRFDADLIADSGGEGFAVGDRIAIGPVLLKVDSGKQCYPECERIIQKKACPLRKGACFAVVLKGGRADAGMHLAVCREGK
ncbi:MAG: hypothetical protein LKM41_04155 [Lachnospiraceae bacterium]|jgi:hypothetical protein|nr:hypothetical protein [Lachnospiraceae bacterium]